MKIGDRVIIYTGSLNDLALSKNNNIEYGTVTNKYTLEEDYSHHGSPWYPDVIEIKGDNGRLYKDFFDHNYNFIEVKSFYKMCMDMLKILTENINNLEHE